jgi:predicted metalloprotease
MRWEGRRQSKNFEDRRSQGAAPMFVGGGLLTILLMLALMFLGVDPQQVAQLAPEIVAPVPQQAPGNVVNDELSQFVRVVLADNEDVWGRLFPKHFRGRYSPPTLVLFSGRVQSACGMASAAAGPFYCPLDKKVYIDLTFYDDLKRRFGAPGDFAQAYVIAHEIGHHVQHQLGIDQQVQKMQRRLPQAQANQLSVRLELQADCLAGVWANRTATQRRTLEEGDIEEALNAAGRIGDDTLQRQSTGRVRPDSFTHGSSAQRQRWFATGLKSGDMNQCDTFNTNQV